MPGLELAKHIFSHYPAVPLEYDAESKQFSVAGQMVGVGDFSGYRNPLPDAIPEDQAERLFDAPNLFTRFEGELFLFPKMYNLLRDTEAGVLRGIWERVTGAMIDAYRDLTGNDRSKFFQGGSHMDFMSGLTRPGHPHFQVVGNCACLPVGPHGSFGHHYWDAGFAEFDLHNVDTREQRTALFAGAGTLSRLCRLELEA